MTAHTLNFHEVRESLPTNNINGTSILFPDNILNVLNPKGNHANNKFIITKDGELKQLSHPQLKSLLDNLANFFELKTTREKSISNWLYSALKDIGSNPGRFNQFTNLKALEELLGSNYLYFINKLGFNDLKLLIQIYQKIGGSITTIKSILVRNMKKYKSNFNKLYASKMSEYEFSSEEGIFVNKEINKQIRQIITNIIKSASNPNFSPQCLATLRAYLFITQVMQQEHEVTNITSILRELGYEQEHITAAIHLQKNFTNMGHVFLRGNGYVSC